MSAWLFLLQQTLCAGSLLLCLGLSMGLGAPHFLRLCFTALACGAVTLCCTVAASIPLRLAGLVCIALLSPMAAWPGLPRARRRRMALCSLMLSLLMAGCGRLMAALGLRRMPLILSLCALLPLILRMLPAPLHTSCVTVEITHDGRKVSLTALVDSGNLLRDPITHLPVIVISRRAAARLISSPAFSPGMRLISVRTITGSALMPIFRPAQIRLMQQGSWHIIHAVIGMSPEGYSGFQALVPACVLISSQGGTSLCP